ncbi:IS21 family transposase [Membranicola marinus]|uniref:IS21 family transposase n=2 Tax=Membranihabitans marinus TaxID=1227546 RepID=A0A953HM66_9BACT|nr:IS21 family transposase [Membranihabitans marinus]
MSKIKQLLQLHKQGESKKSIARILDISRNTVKAYLEKLPHIQSDIDDLIALENPELEKQFHAGNLAYKEDRYVHLKNRLDYYSKELGRVGVTRQLLWEEYKVDYPNGYARSQFFFHLSQHRKAAKPTMILTHHPGEKLYIDFAGKKLSYVDRKTGEVVECSVFVACLPYSDYGFAIAVRNQSVEEFLYALGRCLHFLGGVPQVLVPDNLKSAVIKADRYEPDINTALEDFANHYGTTVIPTRPAKPKDKALVENQVKLVYSRVFAKIRNQRFFSLSELNKAISEKMLDHNQTRMQNKSYCREEKFMAYEKHHLSPLPNQLFEIKYYKTYKVQQNNHVQLGQDNHFYSVPYIYIGQKAKVIYTRSMIRIYIDGSCVATHRRNRTSNAYSTVKDHLCSTHKHYLNRSPGYYIRRARHCCEVLHHFTQLLFDQNRPPEQLYRTCDGILRLYSKTDKELFKRACKLAITHKIYSYGFILKLIKTKMVDHPEEAQKRSLPNHDNIRGEKYYS